MLTQIPLTWTSVNWPTNDTAATQYNVYVGNSPTPLLTVSNATTATVTYDDTQPGFVYVIRPTNGTNVGPSQCVVIANQPLNNRAWLRDATRKAVGDRTDSINSSTPKFADDEINQYIDDAIRNYALQFPKEADFPWTFSTRSRVVPLPADFLRTLQVKYTGQDQHYQLYLKDEPYKGGETTADSWIGYPKLGLLTTTPAGRIYNGHYEVYQGNLTIDFDPPDAADTLDIHYAATRLYPADDFTTLDVPAQDLEMLSIFVQAKMWMQLEAKDTSLSRWRSKEDGGRRDDMPTEKMSARLMKQWDALVAERRTLRSKGYRLVRRG